MHSLFVCGRVGRDPELRQTESGRSVTTFTVADNRRYTTNDGERREETTWFRVTAWGKLAQACSDHLSTGRSVAIQAWLKPDENGNPRIWTDSDGDSHSSFEVTAQRVEFLGSKGASEDAQDYETGDEASDA